MEDKPVVVLLVEDNPGDTRLIQEMLAEVGDPSLALECADRLSTGLERLTEGDVDVVLLDIGLPDSRGLDTFAKARAQAPQVPIIVLTGLDDEALAVKALQEGAQDYLVKGQVDSNLLVRAIRYAIERHRLQAELRAMSLVDELTGLYNRRGFLTLAEQQLKLAKRMESGLLLVFVDVDGLKQINDTFGHQEGDLALVKTAEILRKTFRDSDIVARLGGDEFAVLVIDGSADSAEIVVTRLQDELRAHNARGDRRYGLSMSLGVAIYDCNRPCSIDELLHRADTAMYKQKQHKVKRESEA